MNSEAKGPSTYPQPSQAVSFRRAGTLLHQPKVEFAHPFGGWGQGMHCCLSLAAAMPEAGGEDTQPCLQGGVDEGLSHLTVRAAALV